VLCQRCLFTFGPVVSSNFHQIIVSSLPLRQVQGLEFIERRDWALFVFGSVALGAWWGRFTSSFVLRASADESCPVLSLLLVLGTVSPFAKENRTSQCINVFWDYSGGGD
jgi:hypothetical protein